MQRAVDVEHHPWNAGFEWEDHGGPFRQLTAEHVAQFDEVGYVVRCRGRAPATTRVPCTPPNRQYEVLRAGQLVR